jgi:hypothetical protein
MVKTLRAKIYLRIKNKIITLSEKVFNSDGGRVYSIKSLNMYWSERSTLDIKIINLINILVILGLTYDNAFNFYPTIGLLPYLVLLKKQKIITFEGIFKGGGLLYFWKSMMLH